MKKRMKALAAIALSVCMLAGCGSSQKPAAPAESSAGGGESQSPAAAETGGEENAATASKVSAAPKKRGAKEATHA